MQMGGWGLCPMVVPIGVGLLSSCVIVVVNVIVACKCLVVVVVVVAFV